MVLSSFDTPGVQFPLVSLILGCFIKILHQIWNDKKIQLWVGWSRKKRQEAAASTQMTLRRCGKIQEKCVYLKHDTGCSATTWPPPQSLLHLLIFPTPIQTAMCLACEALATTESSCKNYGVTHQNVGFNYPMKCEKSASPGFWLKGLRG